MSYLEKLSIVLTKSDYEEIKKLLEEEKDFKTSLPELGSTGCKEYETPDETYILVEMEIEDPMSLILLRAAVLKRKHVYISISEENRVEKDISCFDEETKSYDQEFENFFTGFTATFDDVFDDVAYLSPEQYK